jgi:serine/threonine-protein kinase
MTLYKLVAGTLPFGAGERSTFQTVQEALERTAPAPSSAAGLTENEREALRGDVDNIVLKAIDGKPARRYPSAERLAADIRRHLEKRPVEARPKTWAYRAERFVARNRMGAALGAVLAVTLAAAAVALTIEVRHTRQEAERSRRLASFLSHVMGLGYDVSSGPFRAEGRAAHVVDAMRYAADHLSAEMADQPQLEARVRADIGHALAELGYTEEAEKNLTRGMQLVDTKKDPVLAAEIKGYLARNAYLEGDLQAASKQFDESLREMAAAGRPVPPAVESLLLLNAAAVPMTRDGATGEAKRLVGRAVELGRRVGADSPAYALALMNEGALTAVAKPDEGEREIRQGLEIEGRMKPRPLEWCVGSAILGMYCARRGALDEADGLFQEAYPCEERTLRPDAQQVLSLRLARIQLEILKGNRTETIGELEVWEGDAAKAQPKGPWFRAEGAVARGALLCAGGRREEGRLALAGAAAARRQAFGADAASTRSAEKQLAKCGEAGK